MRIFVDDTANQNSSLISMETCSLLSVRIGVFWRAGGQLQPGGCNETTTNIRYVGDGQAGGVLLQQACTWIQSVLPDP